MKRNDVTLGKRNRNPLNIRYSKYNRWVGQVGESKGFCVFKHIDFGFRAALRLLCRYIQDGYDTPEKIVFRWAPEFENKTESYLEYVLSNTFLLKCQQIKTPDEVCELCSAMAYYESNTVVGIDYLMDIFTSNNLSVYGKKKS